MRRTLMLAAPLALLVALAYGAVFVGTGHPVEPLGLLAGAVGWLIAFVLRAPVGLVAMRITDNAERAQTWVTASSGPLEEGVRLGVLLLVGRDLSTALWIGLGWAAIEVVYAIANGFALASVAERTDPEGERIRAMLPASAFSPSAPLWGVVERGWASAIHIGFTLMLAAVPLLVLVTAALHTVTNVVFLRMVRRLGMAAVSVAGIAYGAALIAMGLVLHRS